MLSGPQSARPNKYYLQMQFVIRGVSILDAPKQVARLHVKLIFFPALGQSAATKCKRREVWKISLEPEWAAF